MKVFLPQTLLKFFLFLSLFIGQIALGQTTIFSENMGIGTAGTTSIAASTFENSGTLTYTGSADTRNNTFSTGYTGASGKRNVFITSTVGKDFEIAGANTTAYINLTLSFGIHKASTAGNGSDLKVEVSADGSTYSTLSFPALPTGTGTVSWYERTATGTIPSTANLRIRFTQTGTTTQYRIDDVILTGLNSTASTLTLTPSALTGMNYGAGAGPSNVKDFEVTGTNLDGTQNIDLVPGDNWEISTDQITWIDYAASPMTITNYDGTPTTIYVRLKAGLPIGTYNNTSDDIILVEGYGVSPSPEMLLSGEITIQPAPTATAAIPVYSDGFTANWNAVPGATSYVLNVYQLTGGGVDTVLSENFSGFTRGTTGSGAYSTDVSGSLDTYTQTAGWSGSKIYEAGKAAKMGGSSALGYITTPTLDLSANGGAFTVNFDAMAWSGDETELDILLDGVLVETITGMNNDAGYTLSPFSVNLTGGTASSTITFEGIQVPKARFFLDNVVITQGGLMEAPVTGSPFTVVSPATSYTISNLDPHSVYYYTVEAVMGGINSLTSNIIEVTTKDTPIIWNGTSWSNMTGPTAVIDAQIEGAYSTATDGAFTAKSLIIDSGALTINDGDNVTIIDDLNNKLTADAFIIENNGNLIQSGITNQNTGEITVKRYSSALMRQDYTLWSSPTTGAQTLLDFSPLTLSNRFYAYNALTDLYAAVTPSTTTFELAKGYLIRMPNTHPASPTVWDEGAFIGKPNTGTYEFIMQDGGPGARFNLVGNPYPSPIDATEFVQNTQNSSTTTGTLYFWRKTNNALSPSYSTWTTGGFVSNNEAQVFDPNGVIQTGQGFFVEASGNGNVVEFNNDMRINDHANQFFKSTNTIERNRIWLNATNTEGLFSQTLVGYMSDATNGLDKTDGKYINDGPIALTSVLNDTPYAIQGRSLPFEATDIVPMQFKATTAGSYTIAIDHVDGLFTGSQNIYLRDAITGVDHDLKMSGYTFSSEAGTFAERFYVVYTAALSTNNPVLNANAVVIYKNENKAFVINSGAIEIASIKIFDITGRLLVSQENINSNQTTMTAGQSNEVLLVQITSADGAIVTKKVVR